MAYSAIDKYAPELDMSVRRSVPVNSTLKNDLIGYPFHHYGAKNKDVKITYDKVRSSSRPSVLE